ERMTELANRFEQASALQERALAQAARELLLAQASDWAFMIRSGNSADYARSRVKEHLLRFTEFYEQLVEGRIDEERLQAVAAQDNIFPELNYRYWSGRK